MIDPSTGPLTRERLQELVALPFGEARKEIQKYDPFWGVRPGEKIEFEVIVKGRLNGRAYIKAASQEEADKIADNLTDSQIDWDGGDDFEILSVEPYRARR